MSNAARRPRPAAPRRAGARPFAPRDRQLVSERLNALLPAPAAARARDDGVSAPMPAAATPGVTPQALAAAVAGIGAAMPGPLTRPDIGRRRGSPLAPAALASLLVHAALLGGTALWFAWHPPELPRGGAEAVTVELVIGSRDSVAAEPAAATPLAEPLAPQAAPAEAAQVKAVEAKPAQARPVVAEPVRPPQARPAKAATQPAEASPLAAEPASPVGEAPVAAVPSPPLPRPAAPSVTPAEAPPRPSTNVAAQAKAKAREAAERRREARHAADQAREAAREARAKAARERQEAKRREREARRARQAAEETGQGEARRRSAAATRGGTGGRAEAAGTAAIASYRGLVLAHLARYKQYPDAARERGITGKPAVSFTLSRGGAVLSVSLGRPSGQAMLDQATVAMVRRASPFPSIPAGGPATMTFHAAINYNLR